MPNFQTQPKFADRRYAKAANKKGAENAMLAFAKITFAAPFDALLT